MKSEEINARIREIEEDESIVYESFGGKKFPYVGWFWRDVDFDDEEGGSFGVIPSDAKGSAIDLVGFMENNKWGYSYVYASREQWAEIKAAIIDAVNTPSGETLGKVNDLIQGLLKS